MAESEGMTSACRTVFYSSSILNRLLRSPLSYSEAVNTFHLISSLPASPSPSTYIHQFSPSSSALHLKLDHRFAEISWEASWFDTSLRHASRSSIVVVLATH